MGNFYRNGEFSGQNWGKKKAILLGEVAFIRPLQRSFFGPEHSKLPHTTGIWEWDRKFSRICIGFIHCQAFFPYTVTTYKKRHSQWQNICFFPNGEAKIPNCLYALMFLLGFLWKFFFSYSFPWNYLDKQIWIQLKSISRSNSFSHYVFQYIL